MSDSQAKPLEINPPTIMLLKAPYHYSDNKVRAETPQKDVHWAYNDQEMANRYYRFLFADFNSHYFMIDNAESLKLINGEDLSPKEQIIYQTFKKNMEDNINESILEGLTTIMKNFAKNDDDFIVDNHNNLVKNND